jgi:hypothetical protein
MMKGLAVLALLLAGCDLYFGGGDDDPPCATTGGGAGQQLNGQRDPYTGVCQYDYGCIDSCCYEGDVKPLPPEADWGSCVSQCSNLDEQSCYVTSGCYAAYIDNPAADGRQFWGCWQTAPSGPVQGLCTNLDAYGCSRHDDCIAVYASSLNSNDTKFESCQSESLTYCIDDSACGGDAFCDHSVCYPSPTCTPCPTCGACPDSNTCYGVCVPKDPKACDVIDCGAGYHCEEQCTGDPQMQYCEPVCVADASCANVDCGPGYACAITCTNDANGQTVCSPTCVLDPPVPACETLATEMTCIARQDCVPVYDGQDCTCYPDHCECQVLTYERCETR